MSSSQSSVDAASVFVCNVPETIRSACEKESFYKEHEGKQYCVFHYPSKEKVNDFNAALERKLEAMDFNFRGLWFPEETFFQNYFFPEIADFSYATFASDAIFNHSTFTSEAIFTNTKFAAVADFSYIAFKSGADFSHADFNSQADFVFTLFMSRADFTYSAFRSWANFRYAKFSADALFSGAFFGDSVIFAGGPEGEGFSSQTHLDFQFARMEKPSSISFSTLRLSPAWFVNVYARDVDFINVMWETNINEMIESLRQRSIIMPHRLLSITCRQLASNAKQNNRYEEESMFRYLSMEIPRREAWYGFTFWKLEWWYWAASGYGRRTMRAFMVMAGIWLIFALLYTQVGFTRSEPKINNSNDTSGVEHDNVGQPLKIATALTYSLGVIALQKPEPKPITIAAQSLVLLETVLGPVQAALIALAIRRKFAYDLSDN